MWCCRSNCISCRVAGITVYLVVLQEVAQVYNPLSGECVCGGATCHWFKNCKFRAIVYAPPGVIVGFIRRSYVTSHLVDSVCLRRHCGSHLGSSCITLLCSTTSCPTGTLGYKNIFRPEKYVYKLYVVEMMADFVPFACIGSQLFY